MPTSLPIAAFAAEPIRNQDKGPLMIVFLAWTNALCLIFTCLRIITRKWIVGAGLWYDDWLTIAAMVSTAIGGSLDGVEIHYGFGRPEKYVNDHELLFFGAYTYCEWIQTFITLCCTKLALCVFLLRIPTSRVFIRPLQASIVALIVSHLIITFIWIFQCWPVQSAWDTNIPGRCFSRDFLLNLILAQAIISIFSDFALALVPIIILRRIRMRKRQKIGLCLLMGLGIIVATCCTIRTALNGGALPDDATFGGITNWFWRLFEVQLGIICACIPPLIPGYKWAKQKLTSTWHASEDTTLTSQQMREQQDRRTPSDPLQRWLNRSPKTWRAYDGSQIPQSEKALMGRVFQHKRSPAGLDSSDDYGVVSSALEEGRSRETSDTIVASGGDQRDSLRTFLDNDSQHKLKQFAMTPPDEQSSASQAITKPTTAQVSGHTKAPSFSRRDLHRQSRLYNLSQSPSYNYPPTIPQQSPVMGNSSLMGSKPRASTVRTTGDAHHSLEVDLQPRFDRNRRVFSRTLDLNRNSWMSWFSESSGRSRTNIGDVTSQGRG